MIESKAQRDFNANSKQPINIEAYIQQRLANVTAMQVLERLEKKLDIKHKALSKVKKYPVETTLALVEIRNIISETISEITEACSTFTTNPEKPPQ